MKAFLCIMLLVLSMDAIPQVAVSGNAAQPDASAMLDVKSTTRGMLIPRMTIAQRDLLISPAHSLLIYQLDNMPGYYFNSGTPAAPAWTPLYEFPLPYFRQISNNSPAFTISNSGSGSAILGYNAATTGEASGIKGATMSTSGVGILGIATTNTGSNYGVKGTSSSPQGIGVTGENLAGSGLGLGVFGNTNSSSGTAIYGLNSATYDINSGILGRAMSTSGIGVHGEAPAATGTTYGVYGKSASNAGFGVAGSGNTGVKGETTYPYGYGVAGYNSSVTGNGSGVLGRSNSSTGIGVLGEAMAASGISYGVIGGANFTNGTGVRGTGYKGVSGETTSGFAVYGNATSVSGTNYGVYGNSEGSEGIGVFGRASSSSGISYGVYGQGNSGGGAGVYGLGTGIGVKGESGNADGFSGWFNNGKFFINGRVGIRTTSPSAGLHLKGTGYPESFMFLQSNDNQDAGFRLYEGSLAQWHIFNSATLDGLQIYNSAVVTAIFAKQSNSYVGLNNTSPTQQLDVNGNARFRSVGSAVGGAPLYRTPDGTLTISASDARLKSNISPLQNCLYKVMKLEGVSFNWKDNPGMGKRIGFIAQDFEKIFPELSFTNPVDGYKGISYPEVTAVLAEAIKELKVENDALKARLEKLEKGTITKTE